MNLSKIATDDYATRLIAVSARAAARRAPSFLFMSDHFNGQGREREGGRDRKELRRRRSLHSTALTLTRGMFPSKKRSNMNSQLSNCHDGDDDATPTNDEKEKEREKKRLRSSIFARSGMDE